MEQALLVIETQLFVDPHGSPDEGGVEKFVTRDQSYLERNGKTYQYDEEVEDDDLQGSEDGYNSEATSYEVRKISEEEYEKYDKIIKDYNNLK